MSGPTEGQLRDVYGAWAPREPANARALMVVLLFKARHLRDKDRADFAGALPLLEEPRRAWLRRALGRGHPGHGWLDALG